LGCDLQPRSNDGQQLHQSRSPSRIGGCVQSDCGIQRALHGGGRVLTTRKREETGLREENRPDPEIRQPRLITEEEGEVRGLHSFLSHHHHEYKEV
jgi:hypothetical protein